MFSVDTSHRNQQKHSQLCSLIRQINFGIEPEKDHGEDYQMCHHFHGQQPSKLAINSIICIHTNIKTVLFSVIIISYHHERVKLCCF